MTLVWRQWGKSQNCPCLDRAWKGRHECGQKRCPLRHIWSPVEADLSVRQPAQRLSSAVICSQVQGCLPAMGYSFAAGTTDGPGTFTFRQGMKTENPLWNVVRNFLSPPTECDVTCHAPKPILLATGQVCIYTVQNNKFRRFGDTFHPIFRDSACNYTYTCHPECGVNTFVRNVGAALQCYWV
jgi:hypothetical protein